MEFDLKIQNDLLSTEKSFSGNSGNMGTYVCNFDIVDNADFTWLCVFKKGDVAYQQMIEEGKCIIPKEVLEDSESFQVGCYGTNENMRISTNWIEFNVSDGAYCEATSPKEPAPDVWEELVMRALPYIGETGNWYVYDKGTKTYIDSGMPSVKEVDFSQSANALKGTASGDVVEIDDISPIEHIIKVKVKSENSQIDLTKVTVTKIGDNDDDAEAYIPLADGTVENVVSLYPVTTLSTDTEGVIIDCEYKKDTNKAFDEITNQLNGIEALLGGI